MGSLDYFETLDSFPHLFRFVVHYDHGRSKFGHTCACCDVVLLYTGYGVLGLLNETVVEFYLSWPHEIVRLQSSDSGVSNYAPLSGSFRGGVEPESLPLRFKYYEGVHARFLCKSGIVYLSFDRMPSVSTRPFISIIALFLIPFRGALAFDISRNDNVSRNLNPCIPPG